MSRPSKEEMRKLALFVRKAAPVAKSGVACLKLLREISAWGPLPVAGYLPLKTEISPLNAMEGLIARGLGPVCVPEIVAPETPLRFRRWTPGCALAPGPFNTRVPVDAEEIVPSVVIVPLVAFDRRGGRLGYGGGFYDRTLAALRARYGRIKAVGLAFAVQEFDAIPLEPTDQPLDLIITEKEVIRP